MNRAVSDKVEFIIHKIIIGIAFWIISSVTIRYQQYVIKQIQNALLNFLLYLIPIWVFGWFISVSRKKNQWKPFGYSSNLIGIIIVLTTSVILLLTIGILKIVI